MRKIYHEKRAHSRIKTKFDITDFKNLSEETVDISEGGLSFYSQEIITTTQPISLQINFPHKKIGLKTKVRLVWKKAFEDKPSLYGMEFVSLNKKQQLLLRKELIKNKIHPLVNNIDDNKIKRYLCRFFLKDILEYINEMENILISLKGRKDYSLEIEKEIERLNNCILLKGYCLELLISEKEIIQRIKDNFRELVGVWIYKGNIVKWAFDKPYGYPADHKIIELIYENKPISQGIGLYFDNIFLKSPYAVAIRLRKEHLKKLILKFIEECNLSNINILNFGCGSSREIREILTLLKSQSNIIFTCIDTSIDALSFSQQALSSNNYKNTSFKFINQSVLDIIKPTYPLDNLGKFNLIYSPGLGDYLPNRILKKFIYTLYQLLETNGKLIITHKNREKTFPPLFPDWLCNWKFVLRNKEEIINLIYNCGISNFSLSSESDHFNYIYYFTITKNK
ncbi:MAG: PilZ domain-containing protein [Candidatus Omnitrophica bacterium]|nr:PilZ domain-containing protein [Candidatus Omnitrophota bacterium]MCM8823735.1 PilZ domain-containing protein [Candidatus Omnitrophota bacterium]MCM8827204.1 PilZ domain-containing protein [Candidatus Omnitrophota bacterium]